VDFGARGLPGLRAVAELIPWIVVNKLIVLFQITFPIAPSPKSTLTPAGILATMKMKQA
jgi:hypothetical protein